MELPNRAITVLASLYDRLDQAGFEPMLVGGLATFAWGEPRTTRDFDVAVLLRGRSAETVRAAIAGVGADVSGPFSTDFGPRFIVPFKQGIPVDVFLAGDEETEAFRRARRVEVAGKAFRFVSPEDLVLRKVRNAQRFPDERSQDLADAAGVLFKQWASFDRDYCERECARFDVCDALAVLIDEVGDARRKAGR